MVGVAMGFEIVESDKLIPGVQLYFAPGPAPSVTLIPIPVVEHKMVSEEVEIKKSPTLMVILSDKTQPVAFSFTNTV